MKNRVVEEWIKKANNDFMVAQTLINTRKIYAAESACFHCQQAAEKYLKAFLVIQGRYFSKTHDLTELLDLALAYGSRWKTLAPALTLLNRYSVDTRYPGASADRKEAKAAFHAAGRVRNYFLKLLPEATHKRTKNG
ncbi:MAG: HEPN domain-containing protein [Elusimicrobia bacterium]|nr:HEPN domain-containing protein [Elusimicrobiota bacterium]